VSRRLAASAVLAALALGAAGCGGGHRADAVLEQAAYRGASLGEAHAAIVSRLRQKHLAYHWVACVDTGRTFRGVGVVRCNVNFGDPHIVAYCTVLRQGTAVTQLDDPSIPCGPDRAGWSAPSVTGPG